MIFSDLLDFIIKVWNYLITFGENVVAFCGKDLADSDIGPFLAVFGVDSLTILEVLFGALITTFFTYTFTKWLIPV